jgi:membrane fusion protein, heavy metal efflux system
MSTISQSPAARVPAAPSAPDPSASPAVSNAGWLRRGLPNFVVFALLAGIFFVGHHTGWALPKISELWGSAKVDAPQDWCAEHLVAESACVECNTSLTAPRPEFGFCRVHGVAECVNDHPELAQVKDKPQLPKYDTAAAITVLARPENNSRNTLHTRRVQFASADSATKAGVDVDVVFEQPMSDFISANGELAFDPSRVAHLSSKVPGSVALVLKTQGEQVEPGEVLALVDAAQVGQAKAALLKAIVQLQLRTTTAARLEAVAESGAVPRKQLLEAQAARQEAQIGVISSRQALTNLGLEPPEKLQSEDPQQVSDELRFLGVPDEMIAALPEGTKTANLIPIRAPYSGEIVSSDVVAGEVVDASEVLFTVADPGRMWLVLNVPQEKAKYVKRGLTVSFRPDDGGDAVEGKVSWISPAIDEHTRTLEVRVAIDNSDHRLRDKTFGDGRIVLREEPHAVVVPRTAVQSTGDATFVFVRDKNYLDKTAAKLFHVRQVRLGAQDGDNVEILAGALPGEVVATQGSAVLMAQLLRSNLGAGCGCHDE